MIPRFLQPEVMRFTSVEILTARPDLPPTIPAVEYRLYIRHASGTVQMLSFSTAFARGLALIPLVRQPVALRTEDVTVLA